MSVISFEDPTMLWDNAPPFGRRETLLHALRRLHEIKPNNALIVETGTLRNDTGSGQSGDGWSTVAWGWYASQTDGRVVTVDISPDAIETCRRVSEPYSTFVEYVVSDSIEFLRTWNAQERGSIDLLYLDSLDYIDHERSELHSLAEAEASVTILSPSSLVLFDDTSPSGDNADMGIPRFGGKGARAIPWLIERGFTTEFMDGGQVMLSRLECPRSG